MQPSGRIPLIAFLVAIFAFADTSGQGALDTWPANVRVNQVITGNPEAETSLAVDPNDPLHLVAVWWEVTFFTPERWDKRINYGWTRDGGHTWQSRRLETDVYSSDPAIVADSQGNFYIETIMVPDPFGPIYVPGIKIGVFKSTDGGETFFKTADVAIDDVADKPFIGVDPVSDALYLTWTYIGPK